MHQNMRVGLVLIVGGTGTGKSTLLASMMDEMLRRRPCHLLTYESPIEFVLRSQSGLVAQTEIPRDLASYADAVPNALRRAPDTIMVSETRDGETMRALSQFAQTGHGVYTTLHTDSVAGALPRAIEMFGPAERALIFAKLVDVLRGIVHQRLVPRVGGGRVAIREYLAFGPALREALLASSDKGAGEWYRLINDAARGAEQDLLAAAGRKLEAGLIEQGVYDMLAVERSASC